MEKVTLPEMAKGPWEISRFTVKSIDFGIILHGRIHPPVGETYTKLVKNKKTIVMSDTPAEMRDHFEPVYRAAGSCLINGLGIGLVLKNILLKPVVTDVTVVEISQDLIDLVAPHYQDPRVTIVCDDAFQYQPPKGKRYQMVWHDIWNSINYDNLKEMEKLHRKYGKRTDWQGSWCKWECKHLCG
jgi:hypothetical protein